MKMSAAVLFVCCFVLSFDAVGQDLPKHVSAIELIANPRKFDGAFVIVQGYLVLAAHTGDETATVLYLHKEDADNLLGNSILVVPSKEMQQHSDKINGMYVTLTGKFHAVPAVGGSTVSSIKDIVNCSVWSDPGHPIGVKQGPPESKDK